uniref:Uncharacterized protein n=1 Tax=Anguilla anguilla TaxID=7936 RepID=A0A0E9SK01_ANGAN
MLLFAEVYSDKDI